MQDPALRYVLRTIGYFAASHIMARAEMSPRTGRYEEVLTADLADIFSYFQPAADYLAACGSRSSISFDVFDLHKKAEAACGADLLFAVQGVDVDPSGPVSHVRKVFLVQAKRQKWGRRTYAESTNHVAKARSMFAASGGRIDLCEFLFYHAPDALSSLNGANSAWPSDPSDPSSVGGPPAMFFAQPRLGLVSFLRNHPPMRKNNVFLQLSTYRHLAEAARGRSPLGPEWAWGAAMLNASYFVDKIGTPTGNEHLPPLSYVGKNGSPLDQWLTDVADCSRGVNLSESEFRQILKNATKCAGHGVDDGGTFAPSAIISICFTSDLDGHGSDSSEDLSEMNRNLLDIGLSLGPDDGVWIGPRSKGQQ